MVQAVVHARIDNDNYRHLLHGSVHSISVVVDEPFSVVLV